MHVTTVDVHDHVCIHAFVYMHAVSMPLAVHMSVSLEYSPVKLQ